MQVKATNFSKKHKLVCSTLQNIETKEKFYVTAFNKELTKLLEETTQDVIVEKDEETITDYLLDIDNVKIRYNIAEGKLIEVVSNLNV